MKIIETTPGEFLVVLSKGEDLMDSLMQFSAEKKVISGFLLQGIGMLEDLEIGFFNGTTYEKETFQDAMELISLGGNLTTREGAGNWHLHCAIAGPGGAVSGGHLFRARVAVTVELFFKAFQQEIFRHKAGETLWLIA
ncbi:MAG: DNA-binding protein [Candidatus Wallbacteria bacterium]|nr:DNA-binding protein [Candidatus Wallbacteria bacterium]